MQLLQLQNDISTIDHKHFCILVQGLDQKNSGGFILGLLLVNLAYLVMKEL